MASSTVTLTAADGFQLPAYVSEPAAKPRGCRFVHRGAKPRCDGDGSRVGGRSRAAAAAPST